MSKVLQKQITLDDALLESLPMRPNDYRGCRFRLKAYAGELYLEYGCDGIYVNLIQGAPRLLMHYLDDKTNPFQNMADIMYRKGAPCRRLDISPETKVKLWANVHCNRCAGLHFYPKDLPFPEYLTQGGEVNNPHPNNETLD